MPYYSASVYNYVGTFVQVINWTLSQVSWQLSFQWGHYHVDAYHRPAAQIMGQQMHGAIWKWKLYFFDQQGPLVAPQTSKIQTILLKSKQPPLTIVYIMAPTNRAEYNILAEHLSHCLFIKAHSSSVIKQSVSTGFST